MHSFHLSAEQRYMRKDGPLLQEHVDESEHHDFRREDIPADCILVSLELTGSLLWQYRENEICGCRPLCLQED